MKECRDCWHNYHCPMPQEGYNQDPDICPYNPDNGIDGTTHFSETDGVVQ